VNESRDGESRGADGRCVLLIGKGRLADATERALGAGGAEVVRLWEPSDRDVREALGDEIDSVVVISRSDAVSLRTALAAENVRPGIPLLVTIFGWRLAEHLEASVENARVLSMADIVAPAFAGPLLDPELLSLATTPSGTVVVRAGPDGPEHGPLEPQRLGRVRRVLNRLRAASRPFDASARILVAGALGFLAVLVVEVAVTAIARDLSLVDALYTVTKVSATVGPSPVADQGPSWFKLFSAAGMLLILGFTAVFTAGLVNRLLDRRLTGITGPTAVPRRDHVIVVGLGQVGLRLCRILRHLDVPVVAIEKNPDAPNVARAKEHKLPVVIGSGDNGRLLRRVSVERARALAAVTSDEVENVGIAVTARGLRDDLNIALRAGDGEATTEIRSLFHVGVVRDVYRITGIALASAALGYDVYRAFPYEGTLYLVNGRGDIEPFVAVEGRERDEPAPREPARGHTG
jgi:voltage-gated potassium channel Kch